MRPGASIWPAALALLPDRLIGWIAAFTDPQVVTEVEVLGAWRGVETSSVLVYSGTGFCCDCSLGLFAKPGDELVLVSGSSARVSFCAPPWGGSALSFVEEQLGPPSPPPARALPWTARLGALEWGGLGAAALLLLGALRRLPARRGPGLNAGPW